MVYRPINFGGKDQFPFSQIELIQLRDSRKKIGTNLPYINYGPLPAPEKLLDSASLKKLSEFLKEKMRLRNS